MAVTYSRSYPATDWTAPGRPSLNGAPVTPPSGQTITQLRDATLVPGTYRPGPTTTGVDPTVTLQVTSTHAPVGGTASNPTVYRNLDIRNFFQPVGIGYIRYENCYFRGGSTRPAGTQGLMSLIRPHLRNFTFVDCTFKPQLPDYRLVGMHGYGFTMKRCDVSYLVDASQVFNGNTGLWTDGVTSLKDAPCDAVFLQNYFHDHAYMPYGVPSTDPRWGGGEAKGPEGSHSDGIQWQGGTGIVVKYNYFTGLLAPEWQPNYKGGPQNNSSMQIKPDVGRIANADISFNWFGGGGVTINIADDPPDRIIFDFGNLSDNRFYRTQYYPPTNIILTSSAGSNPSGIGGTFLRNVRDDDNSAAVIGRGTQA